MGGWFRAFMVSRANLLFGSVGQSTAKHSKAQQSTAKHSKSQQSTAKRSKAQQSTAKHSKAQQSTPRAAEVSARKVFWGGAGPPAPSRVMLLPLSESSACQVPICTVAADGVTVHAKQWFLGPGFLGAPSISLRAAPRSGALRLSTSDEHM